MKKSIILLLMVILTLCGTAYAKNCGNIKTTQQKTVCATPEIMFNGVKYILGYSTNKTQSGEYTNEYFKTGENGNNWTELITVSEFPNYPNKTMDYAESILSRDNSPNNYDRPITSSSKTEKVTFVFLLMGKTDDYKYIEFNAMQVLPYKNFKGLKTLNYTKKYKYTTREEYLKAYEEMEADKYNIFNQVKSLEIPEVVHKEIE